MLKRHGAVTAYVGPVACLTILIPQPQNSDPFDSSDSCESRSWFIIDGSFIREPGFSSTGELLPLTCAIPELVQYEYRV